MSKPMFVLVHSAWHRPVVWDPLVFELDKAGYSAVAPGLPSSDPQRKDSPVTDNSEDVATIRKAVSKLVHEQDVVVVMHSLGGLSGSDSLDGLDKQTCTSRGLKGGVIRLIFICAYLVPEGFTYPLNKDTETPHTKFNHENGVATVCYEPGHEVEHARFMFYQDIDDDSKVSELARKLEPQSIAAFWTTVPTKFAAWRHVRPKDSLHEQLISQDFKLTADNSKIPSTYILCTKDRASTVQTAEGMIEWATKSGPHMVDNVIRAEYGHSPFASDPEWTARTLIEEAKRDVKTSGS